MFYVYFARGYANEEMIAECSSLEAACARADEEFDMGSQDVEVYDRDGVVVYEPEEEFLIDEF
jgi:hypothetical protein